MQAITKYLANPYIMAAVIGGGVFVGLEVMKPAILDSIPMATPLNMGMIAAIAYIFYMWFTGKMVLPILGAHKAGSYGSMPMMARRAHQKTMAATMSDLLGPDAF